jgi:hypothetical protein
MKLTRKIFYPRSLSRIGRDNIVSLLAAVATLVFQSHQPAFAQAKPDKDYLVYVLSEAADKIPLIRFGPNGARVDHELTTGGMPSDIDGPHGIAISGDKQFYYVSLAHGRPFGSVWKYSTKDDRVMGQVTLGPARLK